MGSIVGEHDDINSTVPDNASVHSTISTDATRAARRELYGNLRHNLMIMMVTMDEKNHVINNANEELTRHLRRLNGSYPAIADEVSEEARLGSLKHWAYFETNPIRRGGTHLDRRQAAASLAALHATEAAERSEHRREAVLAKKARLNQLDSDFDENRPAPKRAQANGRNRRIGELTAENAGLGISSAAGAKRKKTEKGAAGSTNGERSLAAVAVGGRPMSREPSQQEQKKRKAPTSNPAGTAPARKRYTLTNTSPLIRLTSSSRANIAAQDSPKLVSSPLAGAFGKDAHKRSPVPGFARPASSRARQNSSHTNDATQTRPASSTSRKHTANGNGVTAATPELSSVAAMTGKSAAEVKTTMKEFTNQKGDRLIEDGGDDTNGNSMRGGILLQRSSSKASFKREANASEEHVGKASPRIPAPIITDIRTDRSSRIVRPSKTSTPTMGTFAESPDPADGTNGDIINGIGSKPKRVSRPRMKDHGLHDSLSPKALPPKRSHKKGAGLLAQANASAQSLRNIGASSDSLNGALDDAGTGEDVMSEDEADGDEASDERYCYCNDISYGEMVACDNKNCAREWFHLRCVGLEKAPGKNAKWFCDECKELLGMKREGGGSGVGNGKGRGASVSVGGGGGGK